MTSYYTVPVRITYPGSGGPGYNDWCIGTQAATPSATDADLTTAITALQTFYTSVMGTSGPLPLASHAYFDGTVRTFEATPHDYSYTPWTVNDNGTSNNFSNVLQLGVKLTAGYSVSAGGKRRPLIGRKFIGPIAAPVLDTDGTPVNSYVTTVQTALNVLIPTAGPRANWWVGVISRKHGGASAVTAALCEDRFSVLRSRRNRLTVTS